MHEDTRELTWDFYPSACGLSLIFEWEPLFVFKIMIGPFEIAWDYIDDDA
jgi:hypothetical protein